MLIMGEQIFQMASRVATLNAGNGVLAIYAILIRLFAAIKYILVDTYIGSKLSNWEKLPRLPFIFSLNNFFNLDVIILALSTIALLMINSTNIIVFNSLLTLLLGIGFYLSSIVRVIYFYINRNKYSSNLVIKFGIFDLVFSIMVWLMFQSDLMTMLWSWYILKQVLQISFLRKYITNNLDNGRWYHAF